MKSKHSNLLVVALCGQSGAGKSTIVRQIEPIDGYKIIENTNIIRYLMENQDKITTSAYYKQGQMPYKYYSPRDLLDLYHTKLNDDSLPEEVLKNVHREIYETYAKSQLQLLNDWSTELFEHVRNRLSEPCIMLVDRSPVDFYIVTKCGLDYLQSLFKTPIHSGANDKLTIVKRIAEQNSKTFIDGIIVTYPWNKKYGPEFNDGVRDQYLTEFFTGDNWYNKVDDVNTDSVKKYYIYETEPNRDRRRHMIRDTLVEWIK